MCELVCVCTLYVCIFGSYPVGAVNWLPIACVEFTGYILAFDIVSLIHDLSW